MNNTYFEITEYPANGKGKTVVYRTLSKEKAISKVKSFVNDQNSDEWEGQVFNTGSSMIRKWIYDKENLLWWEYNFSAMYSSPCHPSSFKLREYKLEEEICLVGYKEEEN